MIKDFFLFNKSGSQPLSQSSPCCSGADEGKNDVSIDLFSTLRRGGRWEDRLMSADRKGLEEDREEMKKVSQKQAPWLDESAKRQTISWWGRWVLYRYGTVRYILLLAAWKCKNHFPCARWTFALAEIGPKQSTAQKGDRETGSKLYSY